MISSIAEVDKMLSIRASLIIGLLFLVVFKSGQSIHGIRFVADEIDLAGIFAFADSGAPTDLTGKTFACVALEDRIVNLTMATDFRSAAP